MSNQPIMPRPDPAIGDTFGRLTVAGPIFRRPSARGKAVKWVPVKCECGTSKDITLSNLRGGSMTCGCGQKEAAARIGRETGTKHGDAQSGKITRLYKLWHGMRWRCKDPRPGIAEHYRDKGIRVCQEWDESYPTFRDWALANGYADHLTLDRIDGDKGYGPDNCRWATMKEQQNNRCNNVHVVAFGEEKLVTEWPDDQRCRVSYHVLRSRIAKGWDPEKAISTPLIPRPERFSYKHQ